MECKECENYKSKKETKKGYEYIDALLKLTAFDCDGVCDKCIFEGDDGMECVCSQIDAILHMIDDR